MSDLSEFEVFAKTIYAEARGEPREGQRWVGHVIKNRSRMRGLSIKEVCLEEDQFECWINVTDIRIKETKAYEVAKAVARQVLGEADPTGGCDHYNNPDEEDPQWAKHPKMIKVKKIGGHQFYRWEG